MRRKQFMAGLDQLVEEGTVQTFVVKGSEKDPILGVVGRLQFEVFIYRMANEYGAEVELDLLGFSHARWITGDGASPEALEKSRYGVVVKDIDSNSVVLFKNEWELAAAERQNPKWRFHPAVPTRAEREGLA
jgi:peptide chain release factor 3